MKKCHLSVLWMLLLGSLQVASAQAPPLVAGLGHNTGPTACHHVIDLLLRYGLHSRAQLPNVSSVLLGESIGDVSLVQVSMLDTGSPAAGPTLAITLQNDSQRDVGPFSVSAVATFVRIHPWCPTVTQRVKCVAAGETLELQLQMPHESLAMGQAGGSRLAFNKLVVAIDSFDELLELNEANNLLVIGREQHGADVVLEDLDLTAGDLGPAGVVADQRDHRQVMPHERVELGRDHHLVFP